MKCAMFPAADGGNQLAIQSYSSVNDGLALVHLDVDQIEHLE